MLTPANSGFRRPAARERTRHTQWSDPGHADCQAESRDADPRRGYRSASRGLRCRPEDRRPPAMTADLQREALAVLADVLALSPDVRLGQLFAHLGFLGEVRLGRGLGYIDDDELMSILYRHRAELLARLEGPPNGAASSVSGSSKVSEAAPAAEL